MTTGKTAIVTGAASGIGKACAIRLAKAGMAVVLADNNEEVGMMAEQEVAEFGRAKFVYCNVTDKINLNNVLAQTIENYGQVDVLVNNAGIIHAADFLELQEEAFDKVMAVNLKAALIFSQLIARHMVARVNEGGEPGTIINMASVNSQVAIVNQAAYCISKGGLAQLTRVAAISLAPYGIRVNAVAPGSIMTPMMESINEDREAKTRLLSRTPLGRIGTAEEVANTVAFLASSESSYITGEMIVIDGGRMALNYTVPVIES